MTLQEMLDDALDIALEGGAAPDKLTTEGAVEPLLKRVLYYVSKRAAADPFRQALVTSDVTLAMVNGVVTLSSLVLVEFVHQGAVADPADATLANKMRYVRDWNEFIRPLDNTLGYWIVKGGSAGISQLFLTRPGTSYTPGAGMTGNMTLTCPQVIAVPPSASSSFGAAPEILDDAVLGLAAALKGDWRAVMAGEAVKAA